MPSKDRQRTYPATPDDILAGLMPEVHALAQRLRQLVRETVPEAAEVANPGWHSLGYHHPEAGYFCGIFPQEDKVKLGFEFGALLPDPDGVLEVVGKQLRYLVLEQGAAVSESAIKKLLIDATNLPDLRAAKLALLRGRERQPQ